MQLSSAPGEWEASLDLIPMATEVKEVLLRNILLMLTALTFSIIKPSGINWINFY
jgi:hypothetical protein